MNTAKKKLWAVLLSVLVTGCVAGVDYTALGRHVGSNNCPAATKYVSEKEESYGKNKRILFLLDAGMTHMLCGRYEESNRYFHEAEELAEELWTKSVTKEAAALVTNDYMIPYSGEDFEKALINLFSALNYSMMGRHDEALVECRRLDSRLSLYNDKYENKNVYKEDAFGRYLSGMIYESEGSLDDAYIDYYKAYKAYRDYAEYYSTPMPDILAEDLLRVGQVTRRLPELEKEFGLRGTPELSYKKARKLGKIVLVHLNGQSPVKEEERILIPTTSGPVKLAFPKYVVRRPACRDSELVVKTSNNSRHAAAHLVEDINGIAVKNLDDRKGRVIAKTIARAVIKQTAIHGATKNIEDEAARRTARILMNVLNTAIERADTRSWRTLPGELYSTRVYVPEGRHDLFVKFCGERRLLEPVDIRKGETKFVLLQTMYQ